MKLRRAYPLLATIAVLSAIAAYARIARTTAPSSDDGAPARTATPSPDAAVERSPPGRNPLWALPFKQLSVTRDRPIFSPSRRRHADLCGSGGGSHAAKAKGAGTALDHIARYDSRHQREHRGFPQSGDAGYCAAATGGASRGLGIAFRQDSRGDIGEGSRKGRAPTAARRSGRGY
jgi:hypothetical protein